MKVDAVNVVALVFFASFAIDRITRGLLFLLSLTASWRIFLPDPILEEDVEKKLYKEKKYRLVYFIIASLFSVGLLACYNYCYDFQKIGIMYALDMNGHISILDILLTGVVLVAGSDFLGRLLEMSGAYDKREVRDQPIEVTGTLTLEQPKRKPTPRTRKSG
ncbi:MAG: hypothetical protein OEU92_13035 [Alphaproteobacteria bacterium]|nr:hypothetical protein [Alphaproteobacteria bacterium]